MTIIAGLAVLITIALILGVSLASLIVWAFWLLAGLMALTSLFFVAALIRLLASKRIRARFSKIDRREGSRFETAFYMTEEGEFSNIFPCEGVLRDRFYKKDKDIHIFIDRFKGKRRRVIDKNAFATILLGTLLSIPVPVIMLMFLNLR